MYVLFFEGQDQTTAATYSNIPNT